MATRKRKSEKPRMAKSEKPIAVPVGRIMFPSVLASTTGFESKERPHYIVQLTYSASKAKELLKPLRQEILKVAKEQWGADTKYKDLTTPLKDGNELKYTKGEKEGEVREGFEDTVTFKVKTNSEIEGQEGEKELPIFVGKEKVPYKKLSEEIKREIDLDNGGYYGSVALTVGTYNKVDKVKTKDAKGKMTTEDVSVKGISFYLNSLLYVKDGERFGGSNQSEAFDAIEIDESEFEEIDGIDESEFEDIESKSVEKATQVIDGDDDEEDEDNEEEFEDEDDDDLV